MITRRMFFTFAPAGYWLGFFAMEAESEKGDRPRVVPSQVIERYGLRPSERGLFVLGEDGRPYDLDDVLAALFDLARPHWREFGAVQKR